MEATTPEGAPSFAYFAKGGYHDGIHDRVVQNGYKLRLEHRRTLAKNEGWAPSRGNGAMQRWATQQNVQNLATGEDYAK